MNLQVLLRKLVFMNYQNMPALADRLKYLRQFHNLSQAELAKIAGTTQQAIQQAESGKARQPRYLHQVARALSIPVDWMVFGHAVEEANKTMDNCHDDQDGLEDRASDVLQNFFAMPEKDQELIYELMKSRREKRN